MKKIKKREIETSSEETEEKTPRGRQETYFFPTLRKTIKASSMSEALKKINE